MISHERITAAAKGLKEAVGSAHDADPDTTNSLTKWYHTLALAALEAADAAMTDEEQNAIANKVVAQRKQEFQAAYDIVCPSCGMEVGHECLNLGSGGGPHMHPARIAAAKNRFVGPNL